MEPLIGSRPTWKRRTRTSFPGSRCARSERNPLNQVPSARRYIIRSRPSQSPERTSRSGAICHRPVPFNQPGLIRATLAIRAFGSARGPLLRPQTRAVCSLHALSRTRRRIARRHSFGVQPESDRELRDLPRASTVLGDGSVHLNKEGINMKDGKIEKISSHLRTATATRLVKTSEPLEGVDIQELLARFRF